MTRKNLTFDNVHHTNNVMLLERKLDLPLMTKGGPGE